MEAGRRKRRDDGEVDGKRRKAEGDDGPGKETTTVTEDEIQEFFAILRRIHVAANFFKSRDGKLTAEGRRALITGESETEDLDGEDGVKEGESKSGEVSVETTTGLDLNLEPPSKESFL